MLRDSASAVAAYTTAHQPNAYSPSQSALDRCTTDDVPILRLLERPCEAGFHGFGCDVRWDLQDQFLPKPRRWLNQFNRSSRADVDCQRAFFDAFATLLTRMHWEQEWDAQPYRIAAVPPRTMGKMVHQLVTANYYHLTLGPENRPPLRMAPVPGAHFRRAEFGRSGMPQPGFRWNVLDYGGGMREEIDYKRLITMPGNVFSRPLSTGKRCASVRAAWHCLWQRFPSQHLDPSPSRSTALAEAAMGLYNLSMSGKRQDGLVQYLAVSGVQNVFTQVTSQVRQYMREHLKAVCHRGGPYCGGSLDEQRTPIAAVHVRQGDSCDRVVDFTGPWNAMWEYDKTKGRMERVPRRNCYSFKVYLDQLLTLQSMYGVRTVMLATDDHTGRILRSIAAEKRFNWIYLDYPRSQFKKKAWMEFRSDLDEHAPFSLAAELELISEAHCFVGNMGSHTSRTMYMRMIASTKTAVLPPFISVDGYGLCCGFTDECTRAQVRQRRRPIRECIYHYGLATGGEQWMYHRGR